MTSATDNETTYYVETYDAHSDQWTGDVGDVNAFASEEAADAALDSLVEIGWTGKLRVRRDDGEVVTTWSPSETYTYTIFDANPHTSSGTAWPDQSNVAFEAESDSEALRVARDALETAASDCDPSDGYDVGQVLYALVWAHNGSLVGERAYELTAEDLGIEESEDGDEANA